jgi:hypothetical protein
MNRAISEMGRGAPNTQPPGCVGTHPICKVATPCESWFLRWLSSSLRLVLGEFPACFLPLLWAEEAHSTKILNITEIDRDRPEHIHCSELPVCGRATSNPKERGIGRLIAAPNRKVELITAMVAKHS